MRILHIVPVLALVAFGSILFGDQTEQARPAVLDLIDEPERISTLTISADGNHAAAAVLEPGKKPRTTVSLYSTSSSTPKRFDVAGVVRDLLYMPEGSSVLGIQYKKAKRREGEAQLLRFDPDESKPKRLVRLPSTARDLDFWLEREALLISCSNEVRSLLMPHLLSGPLYSLQGDNLAVASIPGSSRIVVGREDGLILVDLDDPHGLEEMPVRASVPLDYPAIAISASPDGSYVVARLADESVYEWRIDSLPAPPPPQEEPEVVPAEEPETPVEPPTVEPTPEAVPVEEPPTPAAPPPPVVEPEVTPVEEPEMPVEPPTAEPEPEVVPAEEPPPPPPEKPEEPIEQPVAEPEPEIVPVEEPLTVEPTPEAVPVEEPPTPAVPPPPVVEPEAVPVEEPPTPAAPPPPPPQLRGTIDGPASGEVVAVVLRGPNNILHEAQRVKPKSDGTWRASGLQPGRYRVQLDGGGDRVLVTDPPFLVVDVEEDGTHDAGVIHVVRAF